MKLSSPEFLDGQPIPVKYSCDGLDINPPLKIEEVPSATAVLVLIVDDPDVPEYIRPDRIWDHWIVFNIPPDTESIIEGEEPAGVPGRGTAGGNQYQGPCPPDGEHRYRFKLYALSKPLDLPAGSTKREVETAMADRIIEQCELIGTYDRSSASADEPRQ